MRAIRLMVDGVMVGKLYGLGAHSINQCFPFHYPARNKATFLLSLKAGLGVKEIVSLAWEVVTDAVSLTDKASKGRSGRSIRLKKTCRRRLNIQRLRLPRAAARLPS